jgi:hypothetical protein
MSRSARPNGLHCICLSLSNLLTSDCSEHHCLDAQYGFVLRLLDVNTYNGKYYI